MLASIVSVLPTDWLSLSGWPRFRGQLLQTNQLCCNEYQNGTQLRQSLESYIEQQFFNQYNGPKSEIYLGYIDDCIGPAFSTGEQLNQFITAVNALHLTLKYTWKNSATFLAFLDIKVSIEGNFVCTSVH